MTEALGRLVTTLDVIGLEAFVAGPPEAPAALPRTAALSRGPSSPRRCWAFPPPTP